MIKDGKEYTLTHEGIEFRMRFRQRHWKDRTKKSRLYVWLPESDDDNVLDEFVKRDRGGSDPTVEIKERRKNMRALAKAGLDRLKLPTRLRYSIHAGCSMCPCSPGFISEVDLGGDLYIQSSRAIEKAKEREIEGEVEDAAEAVKEAEKALAKARKRQAKAVRARERYAKKVSRQVAAS